MASTDRPDGQPIPTPRLPRRTLVATGAWTVPVVAAAAAAPAYAASPCMQRQQVSTTTGTVGSPDSASPAPGYTRNSSTSATWTTNDPDNATATYTFASITVSETKTSNAIEYGFSTNDAQNLTLFNTGTLTGPTINQRPAAATSPRDFANRTITTFTFDRTVYGLTFIISDVSKSATPETVANQNQLTSVAFWDAVYIESSATFTPSNQGSAVTGSGTLASPFTAAITADNSDQNANSDVTITFNAGIKEFKLHYWSDKKGTTNNSTNGQGITVGNMTMSIAPAICP